MRKLFTAQNAEKDGAIYRKMVHDGCRVSEMGVNGRVLGRGDGRSATPFDGVRNGSWLALLIKHGNHVYVVYYSAPI